MMASTMVGPIEGDGPPPQGDRVLPGGSAEPEVGTSAQASNLHGPRSFATENHAPQHPARRGPFAFSNRDLYEELRERLHRKGYDWE